MLNMDKIVQEFLAESHENIEQMEHDLLVLEKKPNAYDLLANIFRTIHNIKGTCGILAFPKLEALSHAGESLLSRLQSRQLTFTSQVGNTLLAMVDAIRTILANLESNQTEGDTDHSSLIETLTKLRQGVDISPTAPQQPVGANVPPAAPAQPTSQTILHPQPVHEDISPAAQPQPVATDAKILPKPAPAVTEGMEELQSRQSSCSSIRVDVGLLDKLMTQVSELVLVRNQILQVVEEGENTAWTAVAQRLNLITTELQGNVMKTRMQSISTIWNKFPRMVRDLAIFCSKQIRIEMEGKDTELDKTIIEAIRDPLMHLIRNSVDHGIESPETRTACGKPPEGCILLQATHESGHVIIKVSDDGAGMDFELIKQKAIQTGRITSEHAGRMSEQDILNLVFMQGISTAAKVTNVSGRGVGMSVVKTNIEKLGGTIDIQTRRGQGAIFKMKIPLTLTIMPALMVTCAKDRYAIPRANIQELLHLKTGEQEHIEMIHDAPVFRLRNTLLPLVYLSHELRLNERETRKNGHNRLDESKNKKETKSKEEIKIVVLQAGDRRFGLVVDKINDTEEIVVKPLGRHLKRIPVFAGATILGDGRVALILDVMGLAQLAKVVSEVRYKVAAERPAPTPVKSDSRQALLLCKVGKEGRMAMPLSTVARLEEFPISAFERVGNLEVVQYHNQILPIIRVFRVLYPGLAEAKSGQKSVQVVVYSQDGRSLGLAVDNIIDIVEEKIELQTNVRRSGILGCAVLQGRVTELLDIQNIIQNADVPMANPTVIADRNHEEQ